MGRPIPPTASLLDVERRPGFGWCLPLVLLLLPFVYAFGFLFPRGDDFDEVTRAMFLFDLPGGLYEVGREWLIWSGRYTYHFLAVFLGKAGEIRPVYGLVCAAVASLYGVAVYGIAVSLGGADRPGSRGPEVFCGLFAVLALFCCHQNLQTFYMLTDALTMGLQAAAALCFLWMLCRLWLVPEARSSRKARRAAVVVGVLAVGVYEHAAVAVTVSAVAACWLARREADVAPAGLARRRRRDCLAVACWCLGALFFSFLAPGNFYRKAVRHVSREVQWQQLAQAWREWLDSAFWFFDGLWPWAILLLILLLPRPAASAGKGVTRGQRALALTAVLAYLLISGGLTVLHALSDVTMGSSAKLPAGLSLYAACAFGIAVYALAGPAHELLRRLRLPLRLLVLPVLAAFCLSGNLRDTALNAADGGMVALAGTLTQRYEYLAALGHEAAEADAPPKFGLLGELYRPGARKRHIDPALPQAVVQDLRPAVVFPIHMGESLPGSPEVWPNLWVAWLYGVGSVRSRRPDPIPAVESFDKVSAATACAVPQALLKAGVERAWLMQAQGGPNKTFADVWLLLRASRPLPQRIAILRASPVDRRRFMPLPLQRRLLAGLLEKKSLELDFPWRLAGQVLEFTAGEWAAGEKGLYALPVLDRRTGELPGLFLSLDQRHFHRLAGRLDDGNVFGQ